MASGAVALVVATLAFGVSSSVLGTKSVAQRLGFDLTSGDSSFTITSSIYPSPSCSGSLALLYPGTPRSAVFTVQNLLNVPIMVQSITSALDTTDYPAPPADCMGTNLVLPTFTGFLNVPAGGDANSPGVPIELNDNGSPQDDCENYTYHFVYSGSADYTDSTTTSLGSSPNPSTSGQSVTFTATVTGSNPTTDGAIPASGTVTFYSCGTGSNASTCTTPTTELGTETVGSNSQATYSTTSLPVGTTYVEAVYGGSGTDFSGSTSHIADSDRDFDQLDLDHFEAHLLAQPVERGHLGWLHRHRLGLFGHAGGQRDLLQLHHQRLHDQDFARDPDPLGRQGHLLDDEPAGWHHLRRGRLRGLGQLLGLHFERGDPGGQRARDHVCPHLLAQPVERGHLGWLHRHRLGLFGHAGGQRDLLQLHHQRLHDQDFARDPDPLGRQGHLLDDEPAGWHHLRRGRLRGLGQLLGLHFERGDPGGQRARDHVCPHLLAQPVERGHLGWLHRHRLGLFGHAGGQRDLLQLHHQRLHDQDFARDPDPLGRQGHLLDDEPAGWHHLRRGRLRGLGQLLGLHFERGDPGGQQRSGPRLSSPPRPARRAWAPRLASPTPSRPLRARRRAA